MSEVLRSGSHKGSEVSRRDANKYIAASLGLVGVAGVAGAIKLVSAGNGESSRKVSASEADSAPTTYAETAQENILANNIPVEQTETSVDGFIVPEMPDLYQERPWADPEQLVGLTAEELEEIAAMPIDDTTSTPEGFAKILGQKLSLIANAARTPDDVILARKNNFPVGDLDHNGKPIGRIDQYAKVFYMDHLFEGFAPIRYDDEEFNEVTPGLEDFFLGMTGEFERGINDEPVRNSATVFVDATVAKTRETSFPGTNATYDLVVRQPGIVRDEYTTEDAINTGFINVNYLEGANGKYDLGINGLQLNRQ